MMSLSPASECDLPVAKRMLTGLYNADVYADKMYRCMAWNALIKQNNNVSIITPIKLSRSKNKLTFFENLYSSAVSGIRQPIESFFNWIQVKTQIHLASKVRSNQWLAFLHLRSYRFRLLVG